MSWDGNFVIAPLFAVADVGGDRKMVSSVNGKVDASLMTLLQVCCIGNCKCAVEVL